MLHGTRSDPVEYIVEAFVAVCYAVGHSLDISNISRRRILCVFCLKHQ